MVGELLVEFFEVGGTPEAYCFGTADYCRTRSLVLYLASQKVESKRQFAMLTAWYFVGWKRFSRALTGFWVAIRDLGEVEFGEFVQEMGLERVDGVHCA